VCTLETEFNNFCVNRKVVSMGCCIIIKYKGSYLTDKHWPDALVSFCETF
jgi:hypothetical protein